MPERRLHSLFDYYLGQKGALKDAAGGNEVHRWLDRGAVKFGPEHQALDDDHTEEGIKRWLHSLVPRPPQARLTDYLRMGLGHIALDETRYALPYVGEDGLLAAAYRLFKQRGWHRICYEEAEP